MELIGILDGAMPTVIREAISQNTELVSSSVICKYITGKLVISILKLPYSLDDPFPLPLHISFRQDYYLDL